MGALSHFHDDLHLENLLILLDKFLRQISYCQREVSHTDGYGKINELSNYKRNLVSRMNKLKNTVLELLY